MNSQFSTLQQHWALFSIWHFDHVDFTVVDVQLTASYVDHYCIVMVFV